MVAALALIASMVMVMMRNSARMVFRMGVSFVVRLYKF